MWNSRPYLRTPPPLSSLAITYLAIQCTRTQESHSSEHPKIPSAKPDEERTKRISSLPEPEPELGKQSTRTLNVAFKISFPEVPISPKYP